MSNKQICRKVCQDSIGALRVLLKEIANTYPSTKHEARKRTIANWLRRSMGEAEVVHRFFLEYPVINRCVVLEWSEFQELLRQVAVEIRQSAYRWRVTLESSILEDKPSSEPPHYEQPSGPEPIVKGRFASLNLTNAIGRRIEARWSTVTECADRSHGHRR